MTLEQRSRAMSSVSGRDTKAEVAVRSQLHRMGFRFRKNVRTLAGSPDIVLPRYRAVIFIHGCFWHGHEGCPKSKLPRTREEFWANKLAANIVRDRKNIAELTAIGWRVAVIWECDVKAQQRMSITIASLADWLKGSNGIGVNVMFDSHSGLRSTPL